MKIVDLNKKGCEERMATLQEAHGRQELTPYECTFYENLRDGYELANRWGNTFEITVKQWNFLNQTAAELAAGR